MENLDNYIEAYTKNFEFYEENVLYLTQYANHMIASIRNQEHGNVLSLGIGHEVVGGALAELYGSFIYSHHIIDGSLKLVEEYVKNHPSETLRVEHVYFEDFQSDFKFDALEMGFVLEHVDDPGLILRRYHNMLQDDGTLYIAVPNAKSLHRLIGHHAGMLNDMYALSEADFKLGHKRYFDIDSITKLVEDSGYVIEDVKGLMLKPITGGQMKQLDWNQEVMKALMILGDNMPAVSNCIYIEAKKQPK